MPVTKVIILNWNGKDHIQKFLPSVIANTPKGIDILIADNGSTDDSLEYLKANFPQVGLICLDNNYGFAGGYNKASKHTSVFGTDFFIFLNSDVETCPGWAEPLIKKLEDDPRIIAVSPKILSYNARNEFEYAGAAGGFIDGLGYPFCRGRIMDKLEKDEGQYDDSRYVFWASGACFAVRAKAFEEVGGFDEDFFAHMEEIDFCWRAQIYGWKVAVEPKSTVLHLGGGTLSKNNPYKTYLNHRNNLVMLYKNLTSVSILPVIVLRLILDGLSAFVYLFTGKPQLFISVWNAHIYFWKSLPYINKKRKKINLLRHDKPCCMYKGSIVIRYFLGKKKFGNLL